MRNRVWAELSDDEAVALESIAVLRGWRTSEVVKAAVVAFLATPQGAVQPSVADIDPAIQTRMDHLLARLETATAAAERLTGATRLALDMAVGIENERLSVHEALNDIAMSVGILAGSIEPTGTDAAENFG